jgi:hypothetical protein
MEMTLQFLHGADLSNIEMLSWDLSESEFGMLEPYVPGRPTPKVMMGTRDPMMYFGYQGSR